MNPIFLPERVIKGGSARITWKDWMPETTQKIIKHVVLIPVLCARPSPR